MTKQELINKIGEYLKSLADRLSLLLKNKPELGLLENVMLLKEREEVVSPKHPINKFFAAIKLLHCIVNNERLDFKEDEETLKDAIGEGSLNQLLKEYESYLKNLPSASANTITTTKTQTSAGASAVGVNDTKDNFKNSHDQKINLDVVRKIISPIVQKIFTPNIENELIKKLINNGFRKYFATHLNRLANLFGVDFLIALQSNDYTIFKNIYCFAIWNNKKDLGNLLNIYPSNITDEFIDHLGNNLFAISRMIMTREDFSEFCRTSFIDQIESPWPLEFVERMFDPHELNLPLAMIKDSEDFPIFANIVKTPRIALNIINQITHINDFTAFAKKHPTILFIALKDKTAAITLFDKLFNHNIAAISKFLSAHRYPYRRIIYAMANHREIYNAIKKQATLQEWQQIFRDKARRYRIIWDIYNSDLSMITKASGITDADIKQLAQGYVQSNLILHPPTGEQTARILSLPYQRRYNFIELLVNDENTMRQFVEHAFKNFNDFIEQAKKSPPTYFTVYLRNILNHSSVIAHIANLFKTMDNLLVFRQMEVANNKMEHFDYTVPEVGKAMENCETAPKLYNSLPEIHPVYTIVEWLIRNKKTVEYQDAVHDEFFEKFSHYGAVLAPVLTDRLSIPTVLVDLIEKFSFRYELTAPPTIDVTPSTLAAKTTSDQKSAAAPAPTSGAAAIATAAAGTEPAPSATATTGVSDQKSTTAFVSKPTPSKTEVTSSWSDDLLKKLKESGTSKEDLDWVRNAIKSNRVDKSDVNMIMEVYAGSNQLPSTVLPTKTAGTAGSTPSAGAVGFAATDTTTNATAAPVVPKNKY